MASFPRVVFKTIDALFYTTQNAYKYKNIKIKKDVVYDDNEPSACVLDLYRHTDKIGKKIPTIVNFHGGGYMAGNKKYRKGIAGFFVDKCDVCVINVGYHVCEKYKFPQFTRDSLKAIEWVKNHADEFDIDLDNLFIMGDSAGAHMAAHALTILGNQELADKLGCVRPDVKFKGALLYCGPHDILTALNQKSIADLAHKIGNKVLGFDTSNKELLDKYEFRDYISPLTWINESFPPSFICDTVGDVFCAGHGEKLAEELKKRNIPYMLYKSKNKADFHCWYLNMVLPSAKPVLDKSVEFVNKMINNEAIN